MKFYSPVYGCEDADSLAMPGQEGNKKSLLEVEQ